MSVSHSVVRNFQFDALCNGVSVDKTQIHCNMSGPKGAPNEDLLVVLMMSNTLCTSE